MKIQLIGDGIDIDPRIRDLIEDKVSAEIEKYLTDFEEDMKFARIRIEKQSRFGFKVNFDMKLPGSNGHIYTEEAGDDLINVVIAVRKEVQRQIRSYKEKLQNKRPRRIN